VVFSPKKYGDKASLDVDTGRDIKITIGGDADVA